MKDIIDCVVDCIFKGFFPCGRGTVTIEGTLEDGEQREEEASYENVVQAQRLRIEELEDTLNNFVGLEEIVKEQKNTIDRLTNMIDNGELKQEGQEESQGSSKGAAGRNTRNKKKSN